MRVEYSPRLHERLCVSVRTLTLMSPDSLTFSLPLHLRAFCAHLSHSHTIRVAFIWITNVNSSQTSGDQTLAELTSAPLAPYAVSSKDVGVIVSFVFIFALPKCHTRERLILLHGSAQGKAFICA